MLLDEFEKYQMENLKNDRKLPDYDAFRFFYASELCKNQSEHEILYKLSYELYCMQVCMDGLLSDMECISEEIYEHRQQELKQSRPQELRGRLCRMERYSKPAV